MTYCSRVVYLIDKGSCLYAVTNCLNNEPKLFILNVARSPRSNENRLLSLLCNWLDDDEEEEEEAPELLADKVGNIVS